MSKLICASQLYDESEPVVLLSLADSSGTQVVPPVGALRVEAVTPGKRGGQPRINVKLVSYARLVLKPDRELCIATSDDERALGL